MPLISFSKQSIAHWGLTGGQSPVHHRSSDSGMVTAETAVVLPVLVVVAAIMFGVIGHAVDQVRAVDAAESGARAASRGESTLIVQQAALNDAPKDSRVQVTINHDSAMVDVTTLPRSLLGLVRLPAAHATAVIPLEAAEQG